MKIIKKKLKIVDMHCTSCAINIDFDLEDLDGVIKAQTNFAKHISEVEFDIEKIKLTEILDQIKKTGYLAQPLD